MSLSLSALFEQLGTVRKFADRVPWQGGSETGEQSVPRWGGSVCPPRHLSCSFP